MRPPITPKNRERYKLLYANFLKLFKENKYDEVKDITYYISHESKNIDIQFLASYFKEAERQEEKIGKKDLHSRALLMKFAEEEYIRFFSGDNLINCRLLEAREY